MVGVQVCLPPEAPGAALRCHGARRCSCCRHYRCKAHGYCTARLKVDTASSPQGPHAHHRMTAGGSQTRLPPRRSAGRTAGADRRGGARDVMPQMAACPAMSRSPRAVPCRLARHGTLACHHGGGHGLCHVVACQQWHGMACHGMSCRVPAMPQHGCTMMCWCRACQAETKHSTACACQVQATGWLALVTANAAVPAVGANALSFCSLSASWSAAGRPCIGKVSSFVGNVPTH